MVERLHPQRDRLTGSVHQAQAGRRFDDADARHRRGGSLRSGAHRIAPVGRGGEHQFIVVTPPQHPFQGIFYIILAFSQRQMVLYSYQIW